MRHAHGGPDQYLILGNPIREFFLSTSFCFRDIKKKKKKGWLLQVRPDAEGFDSQVNKDLVIPEWAQLGLVPGNYQTLPTPLRPSLFLKSGFT